MRFFSPPEKPTLTPRLSMSCGMFSDFETSRTFFRKSGVEYSLSPRASRCAFSAVRRKFMVEDAGDVHRILERQEHALGGALVRRHLEQVFAVEQDLAVGDLIGLLAGDHVGQGRLAGAVRPHDGGDLALVHGQGQAVEDLTLLDTNLRFLISSKALSCFFLSPRPGGAPAGASRRIEANNLSVSILRDAAYAASSG